jgi:maleylacetoacetate isomerase/maleylpyruvate isomerase
MADICLAGQVNAAGYFNVATQSVPTVERIFAECMKIEAFERSQPLKQPDAPRNPSH